MKSFFGFPRCDRSQQIASCIPIKKCHKMTGITDLAGIKCGTHVTYSMRRIDFSLMKKFYLVKSQKGGMKISRDFPYIF